MPIDPLYSDSTSTFLAGQNQANVPEPTAPGPNTSITSIAKAVGRGIGQGGASLFGAAADTASGLSQGFTDPDTAFLNPAQQAADDQKVNAAIAKGKAGTLFQSSAGTAAYDFADTLKPDPTKSTAIDQMVQGAVSSLTQIGGAAVLGGPLGTLGAIVGGGTSVGMGKAEELKRQGVDVDTRTAIGATEGVAAGIGAVLPVAGSTLARTAGLVALGGPVFSVAQSSAEKAILRNSNYDHLADQIDPLDPVNLAASLVVPSIFAGVHNIKAARAAKNDSTPPTIPPGGGGSGPITDMPVDARKALPYNSPALDAYATQAAQAAGVPPEMLLFIKNRGEQSNSNQVSPAGAKGVMQFVDKTYAAFGKGDPKDPVNSIDAGAAYSADLLKRYDGDVRAALTEYNGGVKQAELVHAGGKPTDPETIAYLKRYDEYAANHQITNLKFDPTPEQTDAALVSHSQSIVDDAHIGPADDVAAMSAHQDAFELAARQMDAGQPVDIASVMPPEFARSDVLGSYAREIGEASHSVETVPDSAFNGDSRHSLEQVFTSESYDDKPVDLAARGFTSDEISALKKAGLVDDNGHMGPDQYAKYDREVSDRMTRKSKAAKARDGTSTVTNEQRAQGVERRADNYERVAKEQDDLGELGFPQKASEAREKANQLRQEAAAIRSSAEAAGTAAREAPPQSASAKPEAEATGASAVEQNVRQAALEQPDTVAHLDANAGPQEGKISDLLKTIDDEHANTLQDASLLQVAANCFISAGD